MIEQKNVIKKSVLVSCNPETAFRVWIEQVNQWWPAGHSISGDPAAEKIFEKGVGGRFFERTTEGREVDLGAIVAWDPPHAVEYDWYLGSGAEKPSRVRVYFRAESENKTLVEVEHRGPELIGDLWTKINSRFEGAWTVVLPAFAEYLKQSKGE